MGPVPMIELPASWASVTEPLRALTAELERKEQVGRTTLADLAAVSARWAAVREAIQATVRAQIADAKAAQARASKP
jgi:hypothetical protein